MKMAGLFSEAFLQAEVAYRRERMTAELRRQPRPRPFPLRWRRHPVAPQPPARTLPVGVTSLHRPVPASTSHCG
jgi:hypothetical protein